MDKTYIQKRLIDIIKSNLQQMNPGVTSPEITLETRPLTDLPNFDSLMSISLTADCCEEFEILDDKTQSFFVEENRPPTKFPRILNIKEVVDKISSYIK